MPEPFKLQFNPALVTRLAQRLASVWPPFPQEHFVARACTNLDALEMKGRIGAITDALAACLPPDYPTALSIVLDTLEAVPAGAEDGMFSQTFWIAPLAELVERYGLEHPELSLAALRAITLRYTSEFAIRPYLERYPQETLSQLHAWTRDPRPEVRRLVSEGSRPRLPWGAQLKAFIADPTPTLALLEALVDDPSEFVRRSVSNHLNDISKDHPALALETARRWLREAPPETAAWRRWIVTRALRTLLKRGDAEALALLGYAAQEVQVRALALEPAALPVGGTLTVRFELYNASDAPQPVRLDLVIHLVRAARQRAVEGSPAAPTSQAKVFRLGQRTLAPHECVMIERQQSFRQVTTRRYYPGCHRVGLQVNGAVLAEGSFELLPVPAGAPEAVPSGVEEHA
jgi:3-methyladenine DNA glycosylase AlkC